MDLNRLLADAIVDGTLHEAVRDLQRSGRVRATGDDRRLVDAAAAALAAVGRDAVEAHRSLSAALTAAGVAHRTLAPPPEVLADPAPALQRIALDLEVRPGDAGAAVAVATGLGYRPWYRLSGGGFTAYRRLHPALPLVAETPRGHPVLLRVAWGPLRPPRPPRLARLRPTPRDLESTPLPAALWVGHLVLRPVRVARDRLRGSAPPPDLGPYLPTPTSLVEPLLDVAAVGPDDVVADLGCGDGRVLVHAASTRGCRAFGVERDAALVDRARARAEHAGVADRVELVVGELDRLVSLDLGDVTVVLLFLDAASLPAVVTGLRARLRPGSRIVAHEQAAVGLAADARVALFAPAGITVAHRWDVRGA